jgi:hypothetical protein
VLRIRDVFPILDTGSRIPDPKTAMKDRGEKKLVVIPFLWGHKFHKFEQIYFLNVEKKKFGPISQRIIELFTQNIVTKLSKIWVWDPGSEIQKKNHSGSRIQGSKRHRIPYPLKTKYYIEEKNMYKEQTYVSGLRVSGGSRS